MAEQPVPDNTLAFADKKDTNGLYPVTGPDGRPVAFIRARGRSFTATTADGAPLCSGQRRGALSKYWDVLDPAGASLGAQRSRWSTGTAVETPDGRDLLIQGRWTNRDWNLTDEQGNVLIGAIGERGFKLHPDAYVVEYDPFLSLAQVVGTVAMLRIRLKARRQTAAVAGAAGAAGGT